MKKIAIVICWIGEFPSWIELWVKSVEFNKTIDFYLYTDQDINFQNPQNLIIQKISLETLKNRFSNVLGFECMLENAYKLCDYKPIYGEAFKEQLSEYDFWGHCDLDMIFGDLRKFITENVLNEYERIFEVGHLSLFKNTPRINQMYKKDGGLFSYYEVFHNKHYCGFDEHTGITKIFEKNGINTYKKVVCADIDPHYRGFFMMDEGSIGASEKVINYRHQIFYVKDGKTYRSYYNEKKNKTQEQEVSYVHFMRKKPLGSEQCTGLCNYLITYKKFIPFSDNEITKEEIFKYDYATNGLKRKSEYISGFIHNGCEAMRRNELWLRIRLRLGRVRFINEKVLSKW